MREMNRIEKMNHRRHVFTTRRTGIFKKARELSILCGAKVGVIVFSDTGELSEFTSNESMDTILSKYNSKNTRECPNPNPKPPPEEQSSGRSPESADLRLSVLLPEATAEEEQEGVDLEGLLRTEIRLQERLMAVKDRMHKLAMEELEISRAKQENLAMANEALREEIEVYRSRDPFMDCCVRKRKEPRTE